VVLLDSDTTVVAPPSKAPSTSTSVACSARVSTCRVASTGASRLPTAEAVSASSGCTETPPSGPAPAPEPNLRRTVAARHSVPPDHKGCPEFTRYGDDRDVIATEGNAAYALTVGGP
jgi:hypothetical protein